MEPEISLPHSQEPAICPYTEPDRSSPCPHPTSQRSTLILSSHLDDQQAQFLYNEIGKHIFVKSNRIPHFPPRLCELLAQGVFSRSIITNKTLVVTDVRKYFVFKL